MPGTKDQSLADALAETLQMTQKEQPEPASEETEEEAPVEEEVQDEEVAEEVVEEAEEEPAVEEEEEEEVSREDELEQEVKRLREEMQDMAREAKTREPQEVEEEGEDEEFVIFEDEAQLDEFMTDPAKANAMLQKMIKQVQEQTERRVKNEVTQSVRSEMGVKETVNEYYRQNPDLREHKDYVDYQALQIAQKKPEASVRDVYKEAGEKAADVLGVELDGKKKKRKTRKKPPMPGGSAGGSRGGSGKDQRTTVAQDVQSTLGIK